MKQLILTLMIVMFAVSSAMADKADSLKVSKGSVTVTGTKTAKGDKKDSTFVPTYTDTAEDGTTVVSTSEDRDDDYTVDDDDYDEDVLGLAAIGNMINSSGASDSIWSIGGIIVLLILLIPILLVLLPIIILVVWLRHRDKRQRERNRLIEKAIEAGQPLPDDIAGNTKRNSGAKGDYNDARNKGIRNMCLGMGLFIFLWALFSFATGCIGMLVFFRGLGQFLTGEKREPDVKFHEPEDKAEH